MQHWWYLAGAIALEIAGTTSMKLSQGFSRLLPSVLLFMFYLGSIVALTLALRKIDVSVAYAIWSGVGTAAIAVIGILFFREQVSMIKVISIGLIVAGVIGVNMGGVKH
jgi:small multidrug resistance pump